MNFVEDKWKYRKLFEPGFIGTLKLKNRLIMAPMGTRLASEIGGVTQRQIDYYVLRAKGGVGTVTVACTGVDDPVGRGTPKNLTLHHNCYIGSHNELVEAIHAHGARAILQLYHVGRNAKPVNIQGMLPIAPSPISGPSSHIKPRQLTNLEIKTVVRKFADGAMRARIAGYDGVSLHGCHGHLISQFMSPRSNRRKDRYGGDLNGRMTFPVEIIQGIRNEQGRDYPILFRMSGHEFVEGGMDLEDAKKAARILEEAGVHALDVSAGTDGSPTASVEPMSYEEGWKIYLAAEIKKVVRIPVVGVGVIRTPEFAEAILKEGKVDFIALGRALLADPYWPQKAGEGKEKEIIPCISCNEGCLSRTTGQDLHIRCSVNPFTGREWMKDIILPAEKKKRVFVVGGGPAGMTAALTAHDKGHRVALFEKSDQLGGQLRLAAKPPGKEKIGWFLEYLLEQIRRKQIKVHLGLTVTPKKITQDHPDSLVIATGASPLLPGIRGAKGSNVCTAWDVLEGKRKIRDKTVLVAGGGRVGCETALYLAQNNKKVILAEMQKALAIGLEANNRVDLLARLAQSKIKVLLEREVAAIEEEEAVLLTREKKRERIKADTIVFALGTKSVNHLASIFEGKIRELSLVGDGRVPRTIHEAVDEGFWAAVRL